MKFGSDPNQIGAYTIPPHNERNNEGLPSHFFFLF